MFDVESYVGTPPPPNGGPPPLAGEAFFHQQNSPAVEEVIGKKKVQNSYKKRSKVFQNVRIFVNTITKAVETMQAVGIAAESQKIQHEDYIEYRVKIPTAASRR